MIESSSSTTSLPSSTSRATFCIANLADALHATKRTLILCGAREQPAKLMDQAEFDEHVGHANICVDLDRALARAADVHAGGR